MSNNHLFPDIKKVIRNCVAVGIIAGVANFQSVYPPSLETFYSIAAGFIIAFGIEFANAYKNKPKPHGHVQKINTFFLS